MTIYAIGDIHGELGKLDRALDLVARDGGVDARIVFIGDYVDRGPDSRGVITRMIKGLEAGRPWTCLLGNHDRMMAWFLEDPPRHDPQLLIGYHWLHPILGGEAALNSYGVEVPEKARMYKLAATARRAVPETHQAFLRSLKYAHREGDLFFAHAGVRPGVPIDAQDPEDLIWIRQEFLNDTRDHGVLVVHGHTPTDTPTHYGNRLNVDGGAGFGRPLVPVAIEGRQAFALTDEGRVPL